MTTPNSSSKMAQLFNERGARCIETGQYDEAIASLVKAMNTSKNNSPQGCDCEHCTLVACIEYSQRRIAEQTNERERGNHSLLHLHDRDNHPCQDQSHAQAQHCTTATTTTTTTTTATIATANAIHRCDPNDDIEKDPRNEGYIYRIPIFTKPESVGHSMGKVLPRIITFNLALAHQLKAVQENKNNYKVVVKLYQLVYQREMKEKTYGSFFFALVAANNLADVHKRLRNSRKQQHCLQFVLSAIMLLGYDAASRNKEYCKVQLDGFFWNATSLILAPTCAPMA